MLFSERKLIKTVGNNTTAQYKLSYFQGNMVEKKLHTVFVDPEKFDRVPRKVNYWALVMKKEVLAIKKMYYTQKSVK